MRVRDIIVYALNNLGQTELAATVAASGTPDSDGAETVNTLLYCFNAVEDEVARCYIPLLASDTVSSDDGMFYFASFLQTPVRIRKVTDGKKEIDYKIFPTYLLADAKTITVEYEYSPSKKPITAYSDYWTGGVSEYLFACGVAAEYCLINGEIEAAEMWESKYRQEIDAVQSRSLSAGAYIPPRRWV